MNPEIRLVFQLLSLDMGELNAKMILLAKGWLMQTPMQLNESRR